MHKNPFTSYQTHNNNYDGNSKSTVMTKKPKKHDPLHLNSLHVVQGKRRPMHLVHNYLQICHLDSNHVAMDFFYNGGLDVAYNKYVMLIVLSFVIVA